MPLIVIHVAMLPNRCDRVHRRSFEVVVYSAKLAALLFDWEGL